MNGITYIFIHRFLIIRNFRFYRSTVVISIDLLKKIEININKVSNGVKLTGVSLIQETNWNS